jgi:syntenin-1
MVVILDVLHFLLIPQINGELMAGYSKDKASKVITKAPGDKISLAVRDRPFERTITMQKDSNNHVGFLFRDTEIYQIVKDSSAARCVGGWVRDT